MRKVIVLTGITLLVACSGADGGGGLASNEAAFHAEQDLLPGFTLDTGLQPSSGPVQLELVVSSKGKLTTDAVGVGTNEGGSQSLVGKVASGKLAIDGGFALVGHLKVDVAGAGKYDGDIPGLSNASISFSGSGAFDPFLLATTSDVSAPVVGTLPSIPLPGGLPGTLDLTIDPGTTLDFSLRGTCAALAGDQATYHASLKRSGTLKITPVVTLKVPVVGSKKFTLPVIAVALPTAPADVDLGTHAIAFSSDHVVGERATQTTCDAVAAGDDGGTVAPGDAASKPDASVTYDPVAAYCSSSGFDGTLTLTPNADGSVWETALLQVQGSSGTHNNATIYRETTKWVGSTKLSTNIAKLLDTTDDYIANDPPRTISSWTPQVRAAQTATDGTITTFHYYATMHFDKFGTDPTCTTTEIDQGK